MRLTILKDDDVVIVDSVGAKVSCKEIPAYVHAIQWDGARGHIEFKHAPDGSHVANVPIQHVENYAFLIDRWRVARSEAAIADKEFAARHAESQAEFARKLKDHEAARSAIAEQADEQSAALEDERVQLRDRLSQLESSHADLDRRLAEAEKKLKEAKLDVISS